MEQPVTRGAVEAVPAGRGYTVSVPSCLPLEISSGYHKVEFLFHCKWG